ncbi:GNAT family N-acetyltransferase [Alphaproteobacteria bacterium]|nr:GNAT family N-acetyltransferase [Alphaproteobacteria bacterium]
MAIVIIQANKNHIKELSVLFDKYRQFYQYNKNLIKAQNYINERIQNNESTIFICLYDKKIVGFVQLYETFDSLNLNKKLILYDLYVLKKYRKLGIGTKLLNKTKSFAINNSFERIELSTAMDNYNAQRLYESLDYLRDNEYYSYELEVKK